MRDSFHPYESLRRHPRLTPRRMLVVAAAIAAVPATLFAVEHPIAVATSLLLFGAVAASVSRE